MKGPDHMPVPWKGASLFINPLHEFDPIGVWDLAHNTRFEFFAYPDEMGERGTLFVNKRRKRVGLMPPECCHGTARDDRWTVLNI